MLAPNTILQQRYRIVRKLGQGGMGAIYEAIDQRVSCVVALKETIVGSSIQLTEAFRREAALLANLRHPALPKVMDYFGEADGEFLVMEFIAGNDLLELLNSRGGTLPQLEVLNWAIELLKLLEYLHTHEPPILHRDLKPANLKVTRTGELFLLDFGLAKGATGQMLTIETDRSVPGYTPIYAPLEQILGQGTDQRSDIYSFGATLYHLLTGQAPVSAPVRFNALENDQPDPLKPMMQVNADIAPEVAACIQKAMALSIRDRTDSARKVRIELEHALRIVTNRDVARKAEQALHNTLPGTDQRDPSKPLVTDDGVQFTVYAPQKIRPGKDYSLLAFAHLTIRRDDSDPQEPDPLEEVKQQAARLLGAQSNDYRDAREPSSQPVPRGGELTFVPVVEGITFNPPRRSFTWRKSVHREEFDLIASADVDGRTLNGSLTVFLGSVVIADVSLTISVDSGATIDTERISLEQPQTTRRVRQVFASYSPWDKQVVEELAHVAPLFGSRFLLDRTHLEPGEDRIEGLQRLIREADVFQLFWSTNSMKSPEIADEIKYAAGLGRRGFILPTYWEEPVPRSPAEGLPPPEIERLQFYRIYPGAISRTTQPTPREQLATEASTSPLQTTLAAPVSSAPTAALEAPPTVICLKCGTASSAELNFCTRCGSDLQGSQRWRSLPPQPASMPPMPTSAHPPFLAPATAQQMPFAKNRAAMMKPIFAAAAMVLLVMVIAPAWFILSRQGTSPNTSPVPKTGSNANTLATGVPADSNPTGNVNISAPSVADLQFTNLDGKRMGVKDFRGRLVLLNIWTTTTTASRAEVPVLSELQRNYASRGLSVIGLSLDDSADKVRSFQKAIPQNYVVGFGGPEIDRHVPAKTLPITYIIDRRGRVRKTLDGPQTRETLEAAIAPLLNERP